MIKKLHDAYNKAIANSRFLDVLTSILDFFHIIHKKESGHITRFDFYLLKNRMLISNLLANVIGSGLTDYVLYRSRLFVPPEEVAADMNFLEMTLEPAVMVLAVSLTLYYEGPIRRYLKMVYNREVIDENIKLQAQRRLLNEPFFAVVLDIALWVGIGAVYSVVHLRHGISYHVSMLPFFIGINNGLIVATLVFFMTEHIVQWHNAPYFFPDGGLYKTPRTVRIRIYVRLVALVFACNMIPFTAMIQVFYVLPHIAPEGLIIPQWFVDNMTLNFYLFIMIGIIGSLFVGMNLSLPFRDMIKVLNNVRNGDYDSRVTVTSNDEIGFTGDAINEMTAGLRDRDRLKKAIMWAQEVQQAMLPASSPDAPGLDIAGKSIYCDETGGDYFDYLTIGKKEDLISGVVTGDVADHGLQSAMLMISARAYIRHNVCHTNDIKLIIEDVNGHLCTDVGDTGRFMTLFFSAFDMKNNTASWIRAGHDPGILFNPLEENFSHLGGRGIPLGVQNGFDYEVNSLPFKPGMIFLFGTDGIWEAQNSGGEYFGKERVKDVIRRNSRRSADDIVKSILAELETFRGAAALNDDVTLVVVKIK